MDNKLDSKIKNRESWVRIIFISAFLVVILYKLVITPFAFNIKDLPFSELLAFLLSLFAVALSAAFYFNASKTSNVFYDNTYKFTKDMGEILGRIEAGFGERLRNLDEGYGRMADQIGMLPFDEAKALDAIQEEEKAVAEKELEREKMFEALAIKADYSDHEKEELLNAFRQKDKELSDARTQVTYLKSRFDSAVTNTFERGTLKRAIMAEFLRGKIIPRLGGSDEVASLGPDQIRSRYKNIVEDIDQKFLNDFIEVGFSEPDNQLTNTGTAFIQNIAANMKAEN